MKWFDSVYYCIYRFILKTPERASADIWPSLVVAITIVCHVFAICWLIAEAVGIDITATISKKELVFLAIGLMALSFWYYEIKRNGLRVIKAYEKRGEDRNYARIGAILFIEMLLLPFVVAAILVTTNRLTS